MAQPAGFHRGQGSPAAKNLVREAQHGVPVSPAPWQPGLLFSQVKCPHFAVLSVWNTEAAEVTAQTHCLSLELQGKGVSWKCWCSGFSPEHVHVSCCIPFVRYLLARNLSALQPPASLQRKAVTAILMDRELSPKVPRLVQITTDKQQLQPLGTAGSTGPTPLWSKHKLICATPGNGKLAQGFKIPALLLHLHNNYNTN